MIDIQKVSVCKGGKNIIEDISCQVRPGKIVVVIGQNGAGKSTLLEALTGTNTCCQGRVNWDGKDLSHFTKKALAIRRAVLSQTVSIDFPITVFDLIETGTYASDEALSRTKIETLVRQSLKEVELSDFAERTFNTLSGGEKKRVLLAKCLVQLNCCHWADMNKYLFLDEPTAGLDIQQQHKLIGMVKKLVRRREIGVFAVLHDIDLAARFADEIVWLKNGKIVISGSPQDTVKPEVIKETLGVDAIVQEHPVFACPHVITLPAGTAQKREIFHI